MVTKGYSLSHAKLTIVKMVRPICQHCRKPIKGGREGDLFHKGQDNKACHAAYSKFKRLQKQGLTLLEALDTLRKSP